MPPLPLPLPLLTLPSLLTLPPLPLLPLPLLLLPLSFHCCHCHCTSSFRCWCLQREYSKLLTTKKEGTSFLWIIKWWWCPAEAGFIQWPAKWWWCPAEAGFIQWPAQSVMGVCPFWSGCNPCKQTQTNDVCRPRRLAGQLPFQ